MDIARLVMAPVLTTQIERSIKMLQGRDTDLPDGNFSFGRYCF
jgi:hypothetical protein